MRWVLRTTCFLLDVQIKAILRLKTVQRKTIQSNLPKSKHLLNLLSCGSENPTQILEVNGTGLALIDFDTDGDLDLFVVNASNQPCRLYENTSTDSIEFTDVTQTRRY